MDTATGSGLMEEFELMKQPKYRVYMQNIDKALKNFEYSSEWADLISALGKLNKVISSYSQYQVIPRRIKISKRLAQCMHPALPSGVHLKALETYDVIFSNTGVERLASELFIYSAGLFPLLGYAAMNVRPSLLEIYEKYFVPLGERLRPALSGFLSGVLPGLEAGLDHFERTNSLLSQVCNAVSPIYFYTCLWECVATNSSIRLPAVTYVLDHYNKRVGMSDQSFLMGRNVELMMSGLCACLNDSVILVQRNTLEFLLLGFPLHTHFLPQSDVIKLVTNALNTILRRDMSLNRRLYSWLLGTEVLNANRNLMEMEMNESVSLNSDSGSTSKSNQMTYFEQYSKPLLIKALRITFKNSIPTADLRPYKILLSLLDKVEIGPVVLDAILIDVIRTVVLADECSEVKKSVNTLFGNFDPSYIWNFLTNHFESACQRQVCEEARKLPEELKSSQCLANDVDSGDPSVIEVCYLTENLLETLSLEMFTEITQIYLPRVLFAITKILTVYGGSLTEDEVTAAIKLSIEIVKHVQPMFLDSSNGNDMEIPKNKNEATKVNQTSSTTTTTTTVTFVDGSSGLEKSKSDSKLNQTSLDEPIKRSRSNHNMGAKHKSPKKSKKSKSHSKLFELDKEVICTDNGQLLVASNAGSVPNLDESHDKKNKKKDKKLKKLNEINVKANQETSSMNESKDSNDTANSEPLPNTKDINTVVKSEVKELTESQLQKYTILEKCSKQYEIFYQIYLSHHLLIDIPSTINKEKCSVNDDESSNVGSKLSYFLNDDLIENNNIESLQKIDELFETLKTERSCRIQKLHSLLNQSLGDADSAEDEKINKQQTNENLKMINKLLGLKLSASVRRSIKFVSQLLVLVSTIPNYNQNLPPDFQEEKELPTWLKVLALSAAYSKFDKELQINCISTLFELIGIVKCQKEKLPTKDVQHLVMLPLLKFGHVLYIEDQTRIFQLLVSTLWDYLDYDKTVDLSQITFLLYQLHSCLDSGLVERVISDRIENSHLIWTSSSSSDSDLENKHEDRLNHYKMNRLSDIKIMLSLPEMSVRHCSSQLSERQSSGFRKFELLWHLGRDQKESFDKILLRVYDTLALPQHISIRTFVVKWLKEALLRGDLGRLLMPLMVVMLSSNTKRISISNVHLVKVKETTKFNESSNVFDEKIADQDQPRKDVFVENEVYVIKMDDGIVRNHLESTKRKSPIGSLSKKLYNMATKSSSSGQKMRDKGLMPSSNLPSAPAVSLDTDINNLFVNPLEPLEQDAGFVTKSCPNSLVEKASSKKRFSDSSSEYSTTSADSMSDNEMSDDEKMKLSGPTDDLSSMNSTKVKNGKKKSYNVSNNGSDSMNDDSAIYQPSYDESGTAADEYFSSISNETTPKAVEEIRKSIIHDLIETELEGGDDNTLEVTAVDSISQIIANNQEDNKDDAKLTKRHSKTSIDSTQKSEISNTNRESTSEQESDRVREFGVSSMSKHQTKKRKNYKKITQETLEKGKANVQILKKNLESDEFDGFFNTKMEKLHPFHTHLLLYYKCYDTKQVLYCLETLRNLMLAGNSKLFLCLSINTSVSELQLKHLLMRHRKSIFGKGFDGSLSNSEFNNAYRGVMYLEVLITLCLYYARSYFQVNYDNQQSDSDDDLDNNRNIPMRSHEKPTIDDLLANCKIQLASIEMLTLIFTELISIVKEMGKGLASYVADLMIKCKVQKVILHCVLTSVHYFTMKITTTLSEKILKANDPGDEKMHLEAIQVQLLKLLDAVIKLEHETIVQKGDDGIKEATIPRLSASLSSIMSQSPTRPNPITSTSGSIKYIANLTISQQPMFLTAILNALQSENLKHLHKNWTELVTSSLNCFSPDGLSNIVVSVMHQLCENIDKITKLGALNNQVPPDYCLSQLEALTVICHFCLLDNNQQVSLSHLFNPTNTSTSTQSSYSGQLYNNILNFFLSSSPLPIVGEAYNKHQLQQNATRTCVLSHLPRIIASMAILWETEMGQERLVKQQLMEFITPIALHHGCNFVAAIAVVWHERADKKMATKNVPKFQQPASATQMSLVKMVLGIKVMPFDSFVQTLNSVIKSPPQIYRPPTGLVLNVSALEFFYIYMRNVRAENLNDSWSSLLNLLKDSLGLSPPALFMLFCILHDFCKECSPSDRKDKKDVRDLHDITSRLIDAIANIAGACLEQTTWLRRNLAVKEEVTDELVRDGSVTPSSGGIHQYSVEAQSILAHFLVNLLDYAYGSQEKDKITQIVTTLMYNIVPYLKNHSVKNIPFFYACSNLLSTLTPYQYTRKAWRKDVFDLLLDPAFFQMDVSCLPFWKQILDNLMSFDSTTFRDLMTRLSVAPTGSLNIFTSKEQEYEQKALLLKKLAFVIFCSERDQYQKYMPEIQEQLSNCLRLPQVIPCVQAAVLLCFRVLLLRMSPDHVTSLWPTIIAEIVQVFLSIEQELMTDTEEFRSQTSQHIRMLSGLDTAWVTNTNNGLHAHGHPSWRNVQLETAKLLELGCVLPATSLPHFQMYRWAFVGSQHDFCSGDIVNGHESEVSQSKFIPHVTRIAQLMDFRYTSHSPSNTNSMKGSHLVLTCQSINNLQDLYGFFSTLCIRWPNSHHFNANPEKDIKFCVELFNRMTPTFLVKLLFFSLFFGVVLSQTKRRVLLRKVSKTTTTEAPLDDSEEFEDSDECPEDDGFFADIAQCDKYYACTEGKLEERLCKDGFVFNDRDSNVEKCDLPHTIDCSKKSKLQTPIPSEDCPRQNGYFGHADKNVCDKFYYCIDGKSNPMTCPSGLVFSSKTGICTWPDETQKTECFKKSSEDSKEDVPEFTCPKVHESIAVTHPRYPDPNDCQHYYICIWSINGVTPRRNSCQFAQVYNDATEICDWPRHVPECTDWYKDRVTDEQLENLENPKTDVERKSFLLDS
ncbi:CLUMA_CG009818, isoform A [Clunio marinus]|uniref:CLUMA_CG009818, isoform A n=1 Tax=Clunio marinus TaxID=568069 RepID=A0A1J1ID78_9DIPT|nr:CLUMA_CG009818, isoform A [Clunio marinus]